MANNKIILGNETLMDLTEDTVDESKVLLGETFHDKSGAQRSGTLDPYVPTDSAETAIADDDYFPFYDTSASGKRKTLWSNIKTKLKTYFDTLYATYIGTESLLKSTVGWTGKNLLKRTSNSNKTVENVTFTVNADNSITCNGTASNSLVWIIESVLCKANEEYILTGCPSGGGSKSTNYWLGTYINGTIDKRDTGSGVLLKYTTDTTVEVRLRIPNGYTANNLVFKPMIRDASITDDTYEPYHESVEEEIEQIYADNGVLGAKNILNTNDSNVRTISDGTTLVHLTNGIEVKNTTAATWCFASFWLKNLPKNTDFTFDTDITITSGKARILIRDADTGDYIYTLDAAAGHHKVAFNTGNYTSLNVNFYSASDVSQIGDVTYDNLILKLASDPDDTYVPYAMTNRELTEKVFEKRVLTSADDLDNILETGIYTVTTSPANSPENITYYTLLVQGGDIYNLQQVIFKSSSRSGVIYTRDKGGSPSAWHDWYKFTGTVVL